MMQRLRERSRATTKSGHRPCDCTRAKPGSDSGRQSPRSVARSTITPANTATFLRQLKEKDDGFVQTHLVRNDDDDDNHSPSRASQVQTLTNSPVIDNEKLAMGQPTFGAGEDSLTVRDNRTGKTYTIP